MNNHRSRSRDPTVPQHGLELSINNNKMENYRRNHVMKKLLTILALAALLCLVCGVAMADVQYKNVYYSSDTLPVVGDYLVIGGTPREILKIVPGFATLAGHNKLHQNAVTIEYDLDGQRKTVIVSYVSDVHTFDNSRVNPLDPTSALDPTKAVDKKASTCTEKGYDVYKCDVCNEKIKVERKLADHNFVKVFASTDCSKGGENQMVCSVCGKVQDGTTEKVGPSAHVMDWGKPKCYKVISVPACYAGSKGAVKDGKVQYLCVYCGKAINPYTGEADDYFYEDLDSWTYGFIVGNPEYNGHKWDEWVHYDKDCYACERRIRWCLVCGVNETEYFGDPTDTALPEFNTASIQHKDGDALYCNAKPGDLVAVCKNCGGDVTGHTLKNGEFFVNGVGDRVDVTINVYGAPDFEAEVVADYNTSYGAWTDWAEKTLPHRYTYTNDTRAEKGGKVIGEVPATCTSGAYTEYCCAIEAETNVDIDTITHPTSKKYNEKKPALGHTWGEWITVVAPNAQKNIEGYWIRNCAVCGLQEDAHGKEIPCTGDAHNWVVKETKPATKDADGSETLECSVCGAKKTNVLKYTPSADPKYEVKDAVYDGEAVSGKVSHVDDTKELVNAYARVTFFYADGTFAVMVVPVEDGEFYAGATTATVHVAVQIVDNAKQITPPATDAIYGNGSAEMK